MIIHLCQAHGCHFRVAEQIFAAGDWRLIFSHAVDIILKITTNGGICKKSKITRPDIAMLSVNRKTPHLIRNAARKASHALAWDQTS